jgi:hypothetical protein
VDSFDPLKAAGPDTIRPIIVQKAWQHFKAITIILLAFIAKKHNEK